VGLLFGVFKVVELPEGAAVRVGWAQKNANLQAPLGFDKFGYRSFEGRMFFSL
jgi:hypothetical protein